MNHHDFLELPNLNNIGIEHGHSGLSLGRFGKYDYMQNFDYGNDNNESVSD